jgi:hypothetical protein
MMKYLLLLVCSFYCFITNYKKRIVHTDTGISCNENSILSLLILE